MNDSINFIKINKNFVSPLMTKKDVVACFGTGDIQKLIGDGWIKRYYQYFKPTQQLLYEASPLYVDIFDTKDINNLKRFSIKDVVRIFNCEEYVALIILDKFFKRDAYGHWVRTEILDELLADGEITLLLKGGTHDSTPERDSDV